MQHTWGGYQFFCMQHTCKIDALYMCDMYAVYMADVCSTVEIYVACMLYT